MNAYVASVQRALPAPVLPVPQQRCAAAGELYADLMCPPGMQPYRD